MIKFVKQPDSHEYLPIDQDTKEVIHGVQWGDDKTGEIRRIKMTNGVCDTCTCNSCGDTHAIVITEKRNFKFVKKEK